MMRRRIGRPGLVGTMARTAVVAGTATATVGAVKGHQAKKQASAAAEQQAAAESQAQLADMQAQVDELKEQQAAQGAPPPPPPPPTAAGDDKDLIAELTKLGELKASGVLDDAEFAAAKARLLAGG
jgi:hypothetical protein